MLLGTSPSFLEYCSLSGLFIGFWDSYAYVVSLSPLSHPTLEAAKVGRADSFADKCCIQVYVGR